MSALLLWSVAWIVPSQPQAAVLLRVDPRELLAASALPATQSGREPEVSTLALLASSAATLGDRETTQALLDRLMRRAKTPGPGWGLERAVDAFADGSLNPPTTIYGLETALATGALLDGFRVMHNPAYLDLAVAALEYYRSFSIQTSKGLFVSYSDQASDRIPVFSLSALLMAQYRGAAALTNRRDLDEFAENLWRGLWSERWDTEIGTAWPYSALNPFWNDALHAGYLGLGLALYAQSGLSHSLALEDVASNLRSFEGAGLVRQFAPHRLLKPKFVKPATAAGVGMLVAALSSLGDCEGSAAIAHWLGPYQRPDGQFASSAASKAEDPVANAHVLFGLARLYQACPQLELFKPLGAVAPASQRQLTVAPGAAISGRSAGSNTALNWGYIGRGVWVLGILSWYVIRFPFERRAKRLPVVARFGAGAERIGLVVATLGLGILPAIYVATGEPRVAEHPAPLMSVLTGAVVYAAALWLFWRSHKDLGRNWSITLELRQQHRLVAHGIYQWLRHPMYAAFWLMAIGQALLLPNWIAGLAGLVGFGVLFFLRVRLEEQMMLQRFGDDYRSYMERTKRVIPYLY